MAIVADGTIQGKEGLHIVSDIRRSHDVIHCEMSGPGMNEGGTGVIALDVDGSISTRGQAPHEREEVSEAISQGDLEVIKHRAQRRWGLTKEDTFLDIVGGKHGQIPWC
ncbi:hypothetical protein AMTR_s00002p00246140 [Amborella trichopoda]|uniref:Uncharacterized protein n=1 Tax=Amborella trichopoda TaxID=13333 RepID=W1P0U9_AMBTC|nr:hypothetical protein AMTR_s00002p00246140 [Amborella trichopoda]